MLVTITEEMRTMAAWAEERITSRFADPKVGNYTGISADGRWYNGFLGELVFLKFCQAHYLRHRYEPLFEGQRDETDFIIWSKKRMVNIDIKTASQPHHRNMILPTAQYHHHPSQVYVGVRLNSHQEGEVMGFAYKTDLRPITLPGGGECMGIPFDELRPIADMARAAVKIIGD